MAALVLPLAGCWILRSRQAANAAHDYLAVASAHNVGTATFQQVYDCSCRLRDAELATPFANRRATLIGYLNRLAHLEESEKGMLMYATLGEGMIEVLNARIPALRAERQALEEELGVKANPVLGGGHEPGTLAAILEVDP
ncbi:MAG TPA: hypothetical protein VFE62_18385 [Gemmataceae bacterium]|nr:hypothetical protein [Gemmataceae bacterium]